MAEGEIFRGSLKSSPAAERNSQCRVNEYVMARLLGEI